MKKLSCESFGDYLIKQDIIEAENKEIYVYGLRQGLIMVFNILTTLALGCIMGMAWQSMVYLIAYVPLRTFAGGFHAKTPLQCYLFSVVLMIAVLLVMKSVIWTPFICYLGIGVGGIIILLLAPIEDSNKPFTQPEYLVFKKKARILLFIEITLATACTMLGFFALSACLVMSLITLALMLTLGKLKNMKTCKLAKIKK